MAKRIARKGKQAGRLRAQRVGVQTGPNESVVTWWGNMETRFRKELLLNDYPWHPSESDMSKELAANKWAVCLFYDLPATVQDFLEKRMMSIRESWASKEAFSKYRPGDIVVTTDKITERPELKLNPGLNGTVEWYDQPGVYWVSFGDLPVELHENEIAKVGSCKQAAGTGETLAAFRQAVTEGMFQVDQAIGHLQEVGADQFPQWVNKLDRAHQALLEISQELNTVYPVEALDNTSDLYSTREKAYVDKAEWVKMVNENKQAEATPSALQHGDRVIDAGNHLGTIVKLPGEEYELPHRPVLIYGRVPEGLALVRFKYTAGGSREELRRIDQLRRAIRRATRKLAWAEGDRVKFTGNPAAAMLYTEGAPPEGTEGTIQTCSGQHGMSIYPDPACKMVFVRFDNGWRGGVYKRDLDLILRKVDRGYEAGQGRHPTTKKPGDPTYSQEWSGVSNTPHAEGASCPNCGGHLHDEDGNFYCPKCDDYVKPVRGSKQAVKSGDIATAMQRGELPNPYVLSEADLGRQIDIVYGMGVVKPFDVGKRVYLRNGYLQMENDDQVRRRKNLLGKQATGEADQELEIEAAGVDTKEFIANAIADLISDNPTERSVAWESIAGLGEMALPYLEEYLGGEFGGEAQMLIKSIKSQMERG